MGNLKSRWVQVALSCHIVTTSCMTVTRRAQYSKARRSYFAILYTSAVVGYIDWSHFYTSQS